MDQPVPSAPSGSAGSPMPQWVVEVVHSVAFCRTASRVAAVLAVIGGVAGLGAALLFVFQGSSGGGGLLEMSNVSFTLGSALSVLLQTSFYVGLLLAASAVLRLQASRLESEVFGEELGET